MSRLLNVVTPLHKSTPRKYIDRMVDDKVNCMLKAKEYEEDYWDGNRRFGYGGYKYDGRWKVVAEKLIETYNLKPDAKILDAGCGKGFLLYEFQKLLPEAELHGFDISQHGLDNIPEGLKASLTKQRAQDPYPWEDNYFDLVISLGCFHNLRIFELEKALKEFERVGKNKYIMLESYRSEQELFNVQCWALTCESFFDEEEWVWLYKHFSYTGDYEFIYFE